MTTTDPSVGTDIKVPGIVIILAILVIRKIANNLRKAGASAVRYSDGNFALIFARKGRNEVLGDLETLRSDIEDFQFSLHPKAAANGKGGAVRYPSARWSLTVTVGVAERGEKQGWSARYGAIVKVARAALNRGRKAGGNTVSK
jgi:GGDEF domain-containing protein